MDHADLVDVLLREPEVTVRERRDVPGLGVRRGNGVFGDRALRGDPSDLIPDALREPEVAVSADRDPVRLAVLPLERELRDRPARRDAADRPRFDSVNQRFPSGPGTIVYGRLSACGSGNSVTSARAPGARSNARPATTSVEAIHGLSTVLPSWLCDESIALRREFLVRR
jgi:hypothetical protein